MVKAKHMILETTGDGPLGIALRGAIERSGEDVRSASVEDPDLIVKATGCRAIVCATSPTLLDATLDPRPSPGRMRAVARATNALSVQLVVAVVPADRAYEEEERVLRSDGIPYVIVRSAPWIEELAQAISQLAAGKTWLPRGKRTNLANAADFAEVVLRALRDDELQGRTIDVPASEVDVADALRRAAAMAGARVKVRATSPALSAAYGKLSGWLGRAEPPVNALYQRLAAALASA